MFTFDYKGPVCRIQWHIVSDKDEDRNQLNTPRLTTPPPNVWKSDYPPACQIYHLVGRILVNSENVSLLIIGRGPDSITKLVYEHERQVKS